MVVLGGVAVSYERGTPVVAVHIPTPGLLRPGLQGYLAHQNPPPPQDPAVALCPGSYGDPRGVGVSYERGIPVIWSP